MNSTRKNLAGQKFGMLFVIEYAGRNKWGGARWKVKCECGKIKEMNGSSVEKATNCGCAHFGKRDKLVGQKFDKLTILEFIDMDERHHTIWKVQCDCGVIKNMSHKNIKGSKSCGECGHINWKKICPINTCNTSFNIEQLCETCKVAKRIYASDYSKKLKSRWIAVRSKSKTKNFSFSLSLEEYCEAIKPKCYYCNGKFNTPSESGVGLDRLDNSKGYEINNIVSCCTTCNYLRGDILSPEETKVAVKAILKFREKNEKISLY